MTALVSTVIASLIWKVARVLYAPEKRISEFPLCQVKSNETAMAVVFLLLHSLLIFNLNIFFSFVEISLTMVVYAYMLL